MNHGTVFGAVTATFLLVTGASAATVTNREAKPHAIVVTSSDHENSYTLEPSESVELNDICVTTCLITLQSGDEYEVKNGDALSIVDGRLRSDTPEQGSGADVPARSQ